MSSEKCNIKEVVRYDLDGELYASKDDATQAFIKKRLNTNMAKWLVDLIKHDIFTYGNILKAMTETTLNISDDADKKWLAEQRERASKSNYPTHYHFVENNDLSRIPPAKRLLPMLVKQCVEQFCDDAVIKLISNNTISELHKKIGAMLTESGVTDCECEELPNTNSSPTKDYIYLVGSRVSVWNESNPLTTDAVYTHTLTGFSYRDGRWVFHTDNGDFDNIKPL